MINIAYILSLIERYEIKHSRGFILFLFSDGSGRLVEEGYVYPARFNFKALEDLRDWLELELAPERI